MLASVHHRPRLVSDDMIALHRRGGRVGLLMLPRMMITDELASGALVPVLQEWCRGTASCMRCSVAAGCCQRCVR